MKVLTIKEPFASLIDGNYKHIETRSWNTHYRGLIYIHAGISNNRLKQISNPEVLDIIKNLEYNYGQIICKATLVDCIYMTEEFIDDLKKNNYQEYLLGHYEVGRYAWILKDIKTLKNKIPAKGKLSIWNMENIDE